MPLYGDYEPSAKSWVRDQVALYEATDGAEGGTYLDLPVIILTTKGVKSGKIRKMPLMRVEHEGSYVIAASDGGADTHPSWYHNVVAQPLVEVQDKTVKQDMIARELNGEEKAGWWKRADAAYPEFVNYRAGTDRDIPLFVLEPVEDQD